MCESVSVYVEHGGCSKQLVTQLRPGRCGIEIRILWRLHLHFCWFYSSWFHVIWTYFTSLLKCLMLFCLLSSFSSTSPVWWPLSARQTLLAVLLLKHRRSHLCRWQQWPRQDGHLKVWAGGHVGSKWAYSQLQPESIELSLVRGDCIAS